MTKSFGVLLGLSLVCACQPIEVNRKVDIPIMLPCKVHLPRLATLPSDEPMPSGLTVRQKRDWMLSALYRDIVLLEGELKATETGVEGCE